MQECTISPIFHLFFCCLKIKCATSTISHLAHCYIFIGGGSQITMNIKVCCYQKHLLIIIIIIIITILLLRWDFVFEDTIAFLNHYIKGMLQWQRKSCLLDLYHHISVCVNICVLLWKDETCTSYGYVHSHFYYAWCQHKSSLYYYLYHLWWLNSSTTKLYHFIN